MNVVFSGELSNTELMAGSQSWDEGVAKYPSTQQNFILAFLEQEHSTGPTKGCKPQALPMEPQSAELNSESAYVHHVQGCTV